MGEQRLDDTRLYEGCFLVEDALATKQRVGMEQVHIGLTASGYLVATFKRTTFYNYKMPKKPIAIYSEDEMQGLFSLLQRQGAFTRESVVRTKDPYKLLTEIGERTRDWRKRKKRVEVGPGKVVPSISDLDEALTMQQNQLHSLRTTLAEDPRFVSFQTPE